MSGKNGHKPAKLGQFRPQRRNANKHTQRGMGQLQNAIQADGWIGAVTVAADGETFDGSARLETLANVMPDAEPLVVHVRGDQPVVVMRDDIPNTDDPRAKRLSIAANRVGQVDLDWDADVLASLAGEIDLGQFWREDELGALLQSAPDWSDAFGGLPDADRAPFQQMTFTLHDTQAEQVKAALAAAKGMGAFVDSPNENSNGNALARICETFLTQHGNG